MRQRRIAVVVAITGALVMSTVATGFAKPPPREAVDLILRNGVVHTVAGVEPGTYDLPVDSIKKTVAIDDGRIVYVGDDNGIMSQRGPETIVVDLAGQMVVPGFVDGHNHAYLGSEELFWLNLRPFDTVAEYGEALLDFRAQDPGMPQIRGVGFSGRAVRQAAEDSGLSPKELLDQYVPDIPVVIISNGHHDLWVNSKALELAGVDADTPDPAGAGSFGRIPGSGGAYGEPNGFVQEFTAHEQIIEALPEPDFTVEQYKETIRHHQQLAAERGVTAMFVPVHQPEETYLQALDEMDEAGQLTIYYDIGLWADERKALEQIPWFNEMRNTYKGDMFAIDSVKIFSVGWTQQELNELVTALDAENWRVYTHPDGYGGGHADQNRILTAYEHALAENGRRDSRHTITHAGYIGFGGATPEHAERVADAGVLIEGHPAHGQYYDSGVVVAASNDYPVGDFWPLDRIEDGVVHNGVSVEGMLISHTYNGAYLTFTEDERGLIEVGKMADLVVLERDIFDVPADEISETATLMTVSEGRIVHQDEAVTINPGRP